MATDSEAPRELELVRKFVNTRDVDEDKDEIATPAGLQSWLEANDLPAGSVDQDDVDRATAAREGLRALLLANNGEPLDPAAIESLNRAAPSVSVRFDSEGQIGARRVRCGDRRGAGADLRRRLLRDDGGHVGPPEGLPGGHLPVGLLRPLAKPLRHLVLDGSVRKPQQGPHLPPAPPGLNLRFSR